ncbi:MAG: ABC transporter ATP-binding protein [Gammaproteobacteria bacterium]|nr:ABC transporter ATP-binding protein [Gammaproteobacteria bacterium]
MVDLTEGTDPHVIDVRHLVVNFRQGARTVRALQGVSLQVGQGEAVGLVGESGSGKSTILRAICGLVAAEQGRISLNGEVQNDKRGKGFYRQVQMVFQDPYGSLHPRHTIDRILTEPVAIQGLGRSTERVSEALAAVGLPASFRFRYPHQLSGGQRQRVAIARALILQPQVLLLDEPTSALDVSVQAEILNLLADLHRRLKLTVLLVSHNLAVVAYLCERLWVMKDGRMVEELSREQLLANQPRHTYTRTLLLASEGYRRPLAND